MKFLRNRKIILAIILVAILGTAFQITHAAVIGTGKMTEQVARDVGARQDSAELLYLLTDVSAKIITLIAGLIDKAIGFGNNVLSLNLVQTGFKTILGFANLGFVLAIIIIAFATIFRMQSYAMKQTLWKLIVAALLVNFSLVIAGAFISVSNTLTNTFTEPFFRENSKSLSNALSGLLKPQYLVKIKEPSLLKAGAEALTGNFSEFKAWISYMVSLFFVFIFTALIIFIFLALFIMLLIRAIYLAFLLILMPIVWLCWIFPGTKKYWEEWWGNFLKWIIFAPAMMFFLFIIINTGTNQWYENLRSPNRIEEQNIEEALGMNTAVSQSKPGEENIKDPGFFGHIAQIIIIGGFLMGSLIVANKIGVVGAKQAMGAAQGGGKALGGWMVRKGTRTAGWAFRGPKSKIDEESGVSYQPTTGFRAKLQTKLHSWRKAGGIKSRLAGQALNLGQVYSKKEDSHKIDKGLVASIWGGMKSGSGLFKKKKPQKFKLPSGEVIEMMPADEEREKEKKKEEKKTV